ncbi:adenylyl-sulfate kinase [Cohnella faecalis]|uniref:Adenylyl-sulfate kinase n=1 Tax=Cohnella faecalis TaxID=2315694 RepID=A0A398CKN9_9BACL|nr:adenylyl-sulfate kinase [Cohnella faecalis]RIE01769.1 adenylyl-sulfate kinase [Cohnella faecalis]
MKAEQLTWSSPIVTQADRERQNGHRGLVLWFTGLSGAGKSTLAVECERYLHRQGIRTYVLDGDNIRHGLNSDLSFTDADRKENIRRIGEVAKLMADAGLVTIVSFISPFRADRDIVRHSLGEGRFLEIYVRCPLAVCERRDPKGLYQKARAGSLTSFTGIDAPYEEPLQPELAINTDQVDVEQAVRRIIQYLDLHESLKADG